MYSDNLDLQGVEGEIAVTDSPRHCSAREVRGDGKYGDQNSCDHFAETFGERTVLASDLI